MRGQPTPGNRAVIIAHGGRLNAAEIVAIDGKLYLGDLQISAWIVVEELHWLAAEVERLQRELAAVTEPPFSWHQYITDETAVK